MLPTSSSARVVSDRIGSEFRTNSETRVKIVLPETDGVTTTDLDDYARRLSVVSDVSGVSAPAGTFVAGEP